MKRLAYLPDLVLGLLVLSSVALSVQLWTQGSRWPTSPVPGASRREASLPPATGEPPDVDRLLEPTEIIAHLGGGRRVRVLPGTGAYAAAWRAVRQAFGRAAPVESIDVAAPAIEQEIDARRAGPALEVELPIALPIEDWALLWRNAPDPRPWPITRRALFSLRPPAQALYWGDGDRTLARTALAAGSDELRLALDLIADAELPPVAEAPPQVGRLRIDRGIYVPAGLWLPVYEPVQTPFDSQALVRTYFADPSGLRRVAERDGAIIFTDGREGLRVYPSGAVEFTAAVPERRSEAASIFAELQAARPFVHAHGSWPDGSHLAGRATVDGRGELSFSHRLDGWPVLGARPPVQLLLQGEWIARYARFAWATRPAGRPEPLIEATAALERLDRAWQEAFPWNPDRRVTAIRLGYASPASTRSGLTDAPAPLQRFQPVWAITAHGGYEAYVDAISGELRK